MSLEGRAMRFGEFVWDRNPETLQVTYERNVKRLTLPHVGEALQDIGCQRRTVSGKGSFLGKGAAATFERLAAVFREGQARFCVYRKWRHSGPFLCPCKCLVKRGPMRLYTGSSSWRTKRR